jgi:hypothetical protein
MHNPKGDRNAGDCFTIRQAMNWVNLATLVISNGLKTANEGVELDEPKLG